MTLSAKASIDLSAIRHNLALARQAAPHSKLMAVIKADAYGHGLVPVANALQQADGLAVARIEEAATLRASNPRQRILLLGSHLSDSTLLYCSHHTIDVVIHSLAMVEQLCKLSLPSPLSIWLKIDTGMHRLGLAPDDFNHARQLLAASTAVGELIAMTHFSRADEADADCTQRQSRQFLATVKDSNLPLSMANSAALIQYPDTQQHWVRPGIMLYGANPLRQASTLPLQPVMTLTAPVIAIREIAANEAVGYNGTWQSEQVARIATIGIGYGDGYPRHAKNGTPVIIRGQRARLAGRVSMDMITVDISDCEGIAPGDEAQLWGDAVKVEEVAACAETISYELLTAVTSRVHRHYSD